MRIVKCVRFYVSLIIQNKVDVFFQETRIVFGYSKIGQSKQLFLENENKLDNCMEFIYIYIL